MSESYSEGNSSCSNLTEEQREFLKKCEEDFANRFTDSDAEYVEVRDRVRSLPPIEDPWNSNPYRDRGRYRDRERERDREFRGDRSGYRDGWISNRYGCDNYHSRYDYRRRDDHYQHYNRSSYHSNYYHK